MYDKYSTDTLIELLEGLETPSLPALGATLAVPIPQLHGFARAVGPRLRARGWQSYKTHVRGESVYLWREGLTYVPAEGEVA